MKKTLLSLSILSLGIISHAQVGVGTNDPKATLDVVGKPTDTSTPDGVIAPRIKRTELIAKNTIYTTTQTGAIVYVTDIAGTADAAGGKAVDVTAIGYYYFDGAKWVKFTPAAVVQDLRFIGTNNHVTQDAGVGSNGTSAGTGSNNIAIGKAGLKSITNGSDNIGIGQNALATITDKSNNIGIGQNALSLFNESTAAVAIGYNSLSNSTGLYNTALGTGAGENLTTPYSNTAIGYNALNKAITADLNTTVGAQVAMSLTSGSNNSIFGYRTARSLVNGQHNTILGGNSATYIGASGILSGNTLIGSEFTKPGVGLENRLIINNTSSLGYSILNEPQLNLINVDKMTFLGYHSDVIRDYSTNSISYGTAIGAESRVGASNSIVLGRPPLAGAAQDNIGIGTIAPTNALHVKTTADPVKFEGLVTDATAANVVVVGADGVLKTVPKSGFAASTVDTTNDAWVNNSSSARVELGTTSAGTARVAGTEIVATDAGTLGIGTATPAATLDVTGEPTNTAKLDAVLPPRLTGDQLKAKTYTATQNGAVVFATAGVTTSAAADQTSDVNMPGLYYFDGPTNKWVYLGSNPVMTNYRSSTAQILVSTADLNQVITFATTEKVIDLASDFDPANSTFKMKFDGYYQLSAFIGFNANQPDLSARQFVGVNLKIQTSPDGSTWTDATGIRAVFPGINAGTGTAIQVPTTILQLAKGSFVRFVIQRPTLSIGNSDPQSNQPFGTFISPNGHINKPIGQTYTKSFTILKVK